MSEDKLLKATATELAKPKKDQLKLLRKYLGDEVVDDWETAYASDEDDEIDAGELRERKY